MRRRLMLTAAMPQRNQKNALIKTVTPQTFTLTDVQLHTISSQKATQTSLKEQSIIHESPKTKTH